MRTWILLLLAQAFLLAACSSGPPPRPPAMEERAANTEKEAHRAFRDGDLPLARVLFERALRLHLSLDNLPGVGMALLNLAAVHHGLKNDTLALSLLEPLLQDAQTPYPQELRDLAAFRRAVILVDASDKDAARAVEDAMKRCGRGCDNAAGLFNLRARLALGTKDHAAAVLSAKQAADAAGSQPEEAANAHRHGGAAEMALGHPARALEHYQAALELDKKLGLPRRIAQDLDGMATALEKLGRKEEAAGYTRRATASHEAYRQAVGVSTPQ